MLTGTCFARWTVLLEDASCDVAPIGQCKTRASASTWPDRLAAKMLAAVAEVASEGVIRANHLSNGHAIEL